VQREEFVVVLQVWCEAAMIVVGCVIKDKDCHGFDCGFWETEAELNFGLNW
jgi:hypothetical protein